MEPLTNNFPSSKTNFSYIPAATASEPAAGSTYVDAMVRTTYESFIPSVNWADELTDDWVQIPVPAVDPDKVLIPKMDDSWGAVKDLLLQACSKWKINFQEGESVGPLKAAYFSPSIQVKDAGRVSDIQYIAGYLEALKSVWKSEILSGSNSTPMFRSGFADALPILLRPAALRTQVMTPEQARVMLREPKRGENNPLKKRLSGLMSVPTNAQSFVKTIEVLMGKISQKLSAEKLDRVLDYVSCNRRAAVIKMYPSAQREVTAQEKGKRRVVERVIVVVQPSIAQSYRTLATPTEQQTITNWNNFSRSENIPTGNRRPWKVEYEVSTYLANSLITCASSMRRLLKDRKQVAYDALSPEEKKKTDTAQLALARSIRDVVENLGNMNELYPFTYAATGSCKSMHDLVMHLLANSPEVASADQLELKLASAEPTPKEGE